MTIRTDNKVKQFKYGYEVPKKTLASYDWLDEDEKQDGWIKYRGTWHHISDFMQSTNPDLKSWHGINTETFFSAIVIKVSSDGETYKIGSCYA